MLPEPFPDPLGYRAHLPRRIVGELDLARSDPPALELRRVRFRVLEPDHPVNRSFGALDYVEGSPRGVDERPIDLEEMGRDVLSEILEDCWGGDAGHPRGRRDDPVRIVVRILLRGEIRRALKPRLLEK